MRLFSSFFSINFVFLSFYYYSVPSSVYLWISSHVLRACVYWKSIDLSLFEMNSKIVCSQNERKKERMNKKTTTSHTSIFVYYMHELNRVELTLVKSHTLTPCSFLSSYIFISIKKWMNVKEEDRSRTTKMNSQWEEKKKTQQHTKINEYIIIIGID